MLHRQRRCSTIQHCLQSRSSAAVLPALPRPLPVLSTPPQPVGATSALTPRDHWCSPPTCTIRIAAAPLVLLQHHPTYLHARSAAAQHWRNPCQHCGAVAVLSSRPALVPPPPALSARHCWYCCRLVWHSLYAGSTAIAQPLHAPPSPGLLAPLQPRRPGHHWCSPYQLCRHRCRTVSATAAHPDIACRLVPLPQLRQHCHILCQHCRRCCGPASTTSTEVTSARNVGFVAAQSVPLRMPC